MRVVAKVQFTSEGASSRSDAAYAIERWSDAKFIRHADGSLTITRSGTNALFERVDEDVAGHGLTHFSILEPIESGNLQTDVRIVQTPNRTAVSTVLSLGSDFGITPIRIALRAPKFIRTTVDSLQIWTVGVGGERVFSSYVTAREDNLDDLQALVEFEHRRLPIVLISEYDGRTLAGNLHGLLASDLCGLAHVVRLETSGALELTKRWGAEWSCYNGAVRLMWPMRGSRGDPRAHPLWTRDRIMARAEDEAVARDRLRNDIGRRVLEASTYVPDDSAFADFAKLAAREAADRARAAAAGSPKRLKESYEQQIADQRAEIDRKDVEIKNLNDNIQSLSFALRTIQPADHMCSSEQLQSTVAEPQSVAEAVETARQELVGRVEIASEIDADIAELNPEAGPPEKMLRYLRAMGELADRLAEGPLGLSVPKWLEERGVDCSGDSETVKRSRAGKKFRQRTVNGREINCEFHAKPSNGVSPDRCARIYFGTSTEAPYVLVGYIGRHVE